MNNYNTNIITHNSTEKDALKILEKLKNILVKNIDDTERYIYIFGCSHTKCFIREYIKINNTHIMNNYMSSVSLLGFTRETSRLEYKKTIIDKIICNNASHYYLFKFGQVDVEYVLYHKKHILLENIKDFEFFENLINDYINVLNDYKKINNNIIARGLNLTNYKFYIYNIVRGKKIELNYTEVQNNIIKFNEILMNKCKENNIKYFDLINETTYRINNDIYIKDEYIGYDYHYRGAETQSVYEENINSYNYTHEIFIKKLLSIISDI